jgi:hypothetical protein
VGGERGGAFRRSDFAAASCARSRWERKTGIAIPVRMPMMMRTARSSMRVKPRSLDAISFVECSLILDLL